MIVACVLRSGGEYTPEHVARLRDGVARHLTGHEFICLSDVDVPCERIPLAHDWPGWWAKLELLGHDFADRVFYFDLDTLIVGDLSEMAAYDGDMAMLSDFYRPSLAQSGVMAWTPGEATQRLYSAFCEQGRNGFRGDGEWLHANVMPDRLQDRYPGQIVSYKVHCQRGIPEGARVICFHGPPRPWQTDLWQQY